MIRVKICGIKDAGALQTAVDAGADFLGFVFARSPRQISPETARSLRATLDDLISRPLTVGVFVNAEAQYVNRMAEYCRLDWVQLSGNESWAYCREIERPFIKVLHVAEDTNIDDLVAEIEQGYYELAGRFICLLDTGVGGAYGGTGRQFNWNIAAELSRRYPIIIAGGLNPDNVSKVVSLAQPWGVDVSSGVETDGQKDGEKIKEFIRAAKGLKSL